MQIPATAAAAAAVEVPLCRYAVSVLCSYETKNDAPKPTFLNEVFVLLNDDIMTAPKKHVASNNKKYTEMKIIIDPVACRCMLAFLALLGFMKTVPGRNLATKQGSEGRSSRNVDPKTIATPATYAQ